MNNICDTEADWVKTCLPLLLTIVLLSFSVNVLFFGSIADADALSDNGFDNGFNFSFSPPPPPDPENLPPPKPSLKDLVKSIE